MNSMNDRLPPELQALAEVSARLGADPLLIQGAGGNTSVKLQDQLWVKASGTWLSEAMREPIFVAVRLGGVRRRVAAGEADPVQPEFVSGSAPPGRRPSIETTLHALMPHAVVLHVHSVAAIALVVRADAREELGRRLDGLRWAWVPYVRPGLPLTAAVAAALATAPADVLLMGNHGLVVGGADCAAAEALLREVERRLAAPPRRAAPPDLARLSALAEASGYRLPRFDETHRAATDPLNCDRACAGSLYPDHVVFLGPAATELPPGVQAGLFAARRTADGAPPPPLLLVRGTGALVRADLESGAEEMARCLALVLERVPQDARLAYLGAADEAELLGWDAEKFRRGMHAGH